MERRAWTVEEIEAMVQAGIIDEDERFELIGGEIVPMPPKGGWHEDVKRALAKHWYKAFPPHVELLTETTLRISATEFREPNFVFWGASVQVAYLKHTDILLLVEVADSSLDYDLGRKAEFYVSLGIRDYWVIDAKQLSTRVHRSADNGRFAFVADHRYDEQLTPLLVPELSVSLAALGLGPIAE